MLTVTVDVLPLELEEDVVLVSLAAAPPPAAGLDSFFLQAPNPTKNTHEMTTISPSLTDRVEDSFTGLVVNTCCLIIKVNSSFKTRGSQL